MFFISKYSGNTQYLMLCSISQEEKLVKISKLRCALFIFFFFLKIKNRITLLCANVNHYSPIYFLWFQQIGTILRCLANGVERVGFFLRFSLGVQEEHNTSVGTRVFELDRQTTLMGWAFGSSHFTILQKIK